MFLETMLLGVGYWNQIEIDEGDPFNQILYAKSLNNIKH